MKLQLAAFQASGARQLPLFAGGRQIAREVSSFCQFQPSRGVRCMRAMSGPHMLPQNAAPTCGSSRCRALRDSAQVRDRVPRAPSLLPPVRAASIRLPMSMASFSKSRSGVSSSGAVTAGGASSATGATLSRRCATTLDRPRRTSKMISKANTAKGKRKSRVFQQRADRRLIVHSTNPGSCKTLIGT